MTITPREEALWKIIDDIDTATDAFHPDKSPFVEYVMRKVGQRFQYLGSDGYVLTAPDTDIIETIHGKSYERGMLDACNMATKALIRYQVLYPEGCLEHRLINTLRMEMEAQRQKWDLDILEFQDSYTETGKG